VTTLTDTLRPASTAQTPSVTITQYSRRGIFAIWAAAAAPMGVLAWIVAPTVADGSGIESMAKPLLACLTIGMVWQFVLAMGLVVYEQRSMRWSRLKEALWLRRPVSPRTGRVGGKVWWIVVPLALGTGLREFISIPAPLDRNLGEFLSSDFGQAMFDGAWGWFAVVVIMGVFNTVLGEELLFRGVLLPRMHGAFGKRDWVANGVLFAGYHMHMPWAMPGILLDTFFLSYSTKRYRSAWIGIAVHSAQTILITLMVFAIVI